MLLSQLFFTPKLVDIIKFRSTKNWRNELFPSGLSAKKLYSLRQMSNEIGVSINVVRKKLLKVDAFNLWKINTKSSCWKWNAKTARDFISQ